MKDKEEDEKEWKYEKNQVEKRKRRNIEGENNATRGMRIGREYGVDRD
jgi:hypothetical protein